MAQGNSAKFFSPFQWLSRVRRSTGIRFEQKASSGRVYIFLTRFGIAYGLIALVIFLMALISQNNLIYLFSFLFISFSIASLPITNSALAKISLDSPRQAVFFKGQMDIFPIRTSRPIPGLICKWIPLIGQVDDNFQAEIMSSIENSSSSSAGELKTVVRASQIGVWDHLRVELSTRYPFGIARAWTYVDLKGDFVFSYPAKGRSFENLLLVTTGGANSQSEEISMREYRTGDLLNRILWKRWPQLKIVKEIERQDQEIWKLDFSLTQGKSFDRLCELSSWIEEAHKKGKRFSVEMDDHRIDIGAGEEHRYMAHRLLVEKGSSLNAV